MGDVIRLDRLNELEVTTKVTESETFANQLEKCLVSKRRRELERKQMNDRLKKELKLNKTDGNGGTNGGGKHK